MKIIEWESKNVKGDGSCFYRALYNSAKNYHTGSLVQNIYDCFGRVYLEDGDDEDSFVEMVRDSLGNRIDSGFYNAMVDQQRLNVMNNVSIKSNNARQGQIEGTMGLYETLINWANAEDKEMYNLIVSELPREFEQKFKKAKTILSTSKDDFYNFLASLIRKKSVYASEYDIVVVKFILEKCKKPIFLNMIHNKNQCIREKNRVNAINVQRVNENHYISWIENSNSKNNNNKNNNNNNNKNKKKISLKNIITRRRTKRNNI
jgi:hypothetical protein